MAMCRLADPATSAPKVSQISKNWMGFRGLVPGIAGEWILGLRGDSHRSTHSHAGPEVGSLNEKRPDTRPLYLLFVELETDLVTIEIYVVSDLESPPNS